jgi:hypothetical protein
MFSSQPYAAKIAPPALLEEPAVLSRRASELWFVASVQAHGVVAKTFDFVLHQQLATFQFDDSQGIARRVVQLFSELVFEGSVLTL